MGNTVSSLNTICHLFTSFFKIYEPHSFFLLHLYNTTLLNVLTSHLVENIESIWWIKSSCSKCHLYKDSFISTLLFLFLFYHNEKGSAPNKAKPFTLPVDFTPIFLFGTSSCHLTTSQNL